MKKVNKIKCIKGFCNKFLLFLLITSMLLPIFPIGQNKIVAEASDKIQLTFDDDISDEYMLVKSVKQTPQIELWHYSGGYWGNSQIRITDKSLNYNLANLEPAVIGQGGYPLEVDYPDEVVKAMREGKKVLVQIKSSSSYPIGDYVNYIEDPTQHQLTDMGGKLRIQTFPKFSYEIDDFNEVIDYSYFGIKTGVQIPFVKDGFGYNGYSIYYIKGTMPREWGSFAKWSDRPEDGKILPSIINPNGTLKPGYNIETTRGTFKSEEIRIGASAGVFNSGGAVAVQFIYPFEYNFYIEKENQSNMVLKELKLIDAKTGNVLESFVREVDNLDPMNIAKQKLIRTNTSPFNASILKREDTYKVVAKYQFISFTEGAFDISKPETMTDKQRNLSTKVTPNQIEKMFAYDEKWNQDGVFDETGLVLSSDKPYTDLKNLDVASFEWDFKVPDKAKKYVKIASMIPGVFKDNEADEIAGDNWGALFARLEPIDIGMGRNVRLINQNNEVIKTYRKNTPLRVIFPVEHILGQEAIGTHATNNPKVIVNVEVTDGNDRVIHREKIQTPSLLEPKKTIDMPITKPFVTDSDKITVCGTIDPIHKEKGYNDDERNDKICVTYRAGGVDIGMASPVELLQGGKSVKFVEPNKHHTVSFNVKHFFGDEAVGLNNTTNPKVKMKITVKDGNDRLLLEQNVQTNLLLNPEATIKMPTSSNFSTNTGKIVACATIDPIHEQLGYNMDPSNDTMCATFMAAKNYAIKDLKATPMSVHFGSGESSINQPVTLTFTVANESSSETGTIPSNPTVVIKHGGTTIWEGTVSVGPGQTVQRVMTFTRTLRTGANEFSVEVNPYRTTQEFMPGVSDPYADNKKTTSIQGVSYAKCDECMTSRVRNRNTWQERWEWYEQRGNVRTGYFDYCRRWEREWEEGYWYTDSRGNDRWVDGYWYTYCADWDYNVPYEYCQVTYSKSWSEIHDYYEDFRIKNVFFKSKWSEDTRGGWIDIKGGGTGKIKAGYGFELKIITNYNTNRHILPLPNPYQANYYRGDRYGVHGSGYCDYITRYPGLTPIDSPNQTYMIMPYFDRSGQNVCYILTPTSSSAWYNNTKTFELPMRNSFGIKNERKIYINEGAAPQTKRIDIYTPRPDKGDRFWGYYPENPVGRPDKDYLHDCTSFYIEILAQDDMKTHISQ